MEQHLNPRHEFQDFRDRLHRQGISPPSSSPSMWKNFKQAILVLEKPVIIGFTLYHLYLIFGWLSDWYAKMRAERYGHWKRDHARQLHAEGPQSAKIFWDWLSDIGQFSKRMLKTGFDMKVVLWNIAYNSLKSKNGYWTLIVLIVMLESDVLHSSWILSSISQSSSDWLCKRE